tara:strand:+ start:3185 stop:3412 length:228 start_codon:yes stop_codon:yes gene_type:complete
MKTQKQVLTKIVEDKALSSYDTYMAGDWFYMASSWEAVCFYAYLFDLKDDLEILHEKINVMIEARFKEILKDKEK